MTGRDWDLRGARLSGFRFAEWLLLEGSLDSFSAQYQSDPQRAWDSAQAYGWVETVRPRRKDACEPGYRREPWPRLTDRGHLEVERVRSLRNNPQARATSCREALLLWLAHEGRGAGSAGLMGSRDDWRFYDDPFTENESNAAAEFLKEEGLVEGWTYPGGTFMQPRLTAAGRQCVDFFEANVREFLRTTQTGATVNNQQNFYGAVHGQVGQGQNVTQTQVNGIDAAALSTIFTAMRDALSTVADVADREDLEHGIRQLEAAVEGGDAETITANAGRLQRLGARVGTAAGNTAITAATAEGVKQVLSAFGLG
jgi:hypothetical protein